MSWILRTLETCTAQSEEGEPMRRSERKHRRVKGETLPIRQCAICLRRLGLRAKDICTILQVEQSALIRWFKDAGFAPYKPYRNGYREKLKIRSAITHMRRRARKCLSRRPARLPRIAKITDGMTRAQVAAYRYRHDIQYRLRMLLRRRIRKVIESGVKRGSSLELLGCTTEQFKVHIENQFELGMSWDNQGDWHLDHIKPCAAFDLTKPANQRACFHYTNYRPLWKSDNAAKGAKWKEHARC